MSIDHDINYSRTEMQQEVLIRRQTIISQKTSGTAFDIYP